MWRCRNRGISEQERVFRNQHAVVQNERERKNRPRRTCGTCVLEKWKSGQDGKYTAALR